MSEDPIVLEPGKRGFDTVDALRAPPDPLFRDRVLVRDAVCLAIVEVLYPTCEDNPNAVT